MIISDEFDFISGIIASHVVFDDVLNNEFVCFVYAGELVPVKDLMGEAVSGGRLGVMGVGVEVCVGVSQNTLGNKWSDIPSAISS